MTLRDDYEHWARHFARPMGEGWGAFLDRLFATGSSGVVWGRQFVPGESMKAGSTPPTYTDVTSGGGGAWVFADSANQFVTFSVDMPNSYKEGTDIQPHIHWGPANSSAGDVNWAVRYTWVNIDSSSATFSSYSNQIDTGTASGTADKHQIADLGDITGTGKKIGSVILCRLYRLGTSGNDTYTGGANLYGASFGFEMDTIGGSSVHTK